MIRQDTRSAIKEVAIALGELNDHAVFVGGSTIAFYLPSRFQSQVRVTDDVDVVMEIIGTQGNSINEAKLRALGFSNDRSEDAPACRWIVQGQKVDIMSTDGTAMGFTNRWYKDGVSHSVIQVIDSVEVKIFSLPYFIASKMEAFRNRGYPNFMGSTDMEDIISVLDLSSPEILEGLIPSLPRGVCNYLRDEFKNLIEDRDFLDAVPGAVLDRANAEVRAASVISRIQSLQITLK